jgi:hypothetical protein
MRHAVLPSALLLALLWLAFVVPASGHEGEGPSLDLLENRVLAGQQVRVFGDDLGPNDTVVLELSAFGEVHPLGAATTDGDGHLEAEVVVPSAVRDGYAELRATTTSGSIAAIWILVGERDLGAGLPGGSSLVDQPPIWADPSVLLLGVVLGGAGLALLYVFLRRAARTKTGPRRS